MQNFSAVRYFILGQLLQQMKESTTDLDQDELFTPQEGLDKLLDNVVRYCDEINLYVSARLTQNLKGVIGVYGTDGKPATDTNREFSKRIDHIAETMAIEMRRNVFMYIPVERARLYNQKELFGEKVNAKFPAIQFDLVEAGNCYASGRGTASVFHLMRIMEHAVQQFGTKLGVLLPNEKNWQNILDEINKKIKTLPKGPATVEMAEAAANLYAVKLAWRNEVMHPKDTYTLEEADNLIRQVRIFVQQLEKIV